MSLPVEWQMLIDATPEDNAPPAVRRLFVPGGWLYQVESCELEWGSRVRMIRMWHPPVFVADENAKWRAGETPCALPSSVPLR